LDSCIDPYLIARLSGVNIAALATFLPKFPVPNVSLWKVQPAGPNRGYFRGLLVFLESVFEL
jgi:hypothetical protein